MKDKNYLKETFALVPQSFLEELSSNQNQILSLLSEEREQINGIGDFITEPEAARLWAGKLLGSGNCGSRELWDLRRLETRYFTLSWIFLASYRKIRREVIMFNSNQPGEHELASTKMSYYLNCSEKKSKKEITLRKLLEQIKSGEFIREDILKLRGENDAAKVNEIKKKLPAVTTSGLFNGRRRREDLLQHSGLIQIDIDKPANLSSLRVQLEDDMYSFAVFLSPSGFGLKLIVRIPTDAELHGNVFLQLEEYYERKYNVKIDSSCKDVSRLMFLSYDPSICIKENAKEFPIESIEESLFEEALAKIESQGSFQKGKRNKFVFKLASQCAKMGIRKEFTIQRIQEKFIADDFSEKEIKTSVMSAYNYPENSPTQEGGTNLRNEVKISRWTKVEAYINEKYELRYDVVACKIEARRRGSNEKFEQLNEHNIYRDLLHNHIDISLAKLKSLLSSDFVSKHDPLLNYFLSLPKWNSNTNEDYIDLLSYYVPVIDQERFKKHFKKMLVRCIACALEPAVFNKQAFILVHDEQNSGKSTFTRWLCPPALQDYFTENISLDKDGQIALASCFLINLDELATLSKSDLNGLKSLFSKDKINIRLPYDPRATVHPRRASFLGSTNKNQFLADETGSVRWLCFELIGRINFDYRKDFNIDDIWRQAYSLYQEGFEYELTSNEIAENERINDRFLNTTPELELIPKHFITGSKGDEFLTASDIAEVLCRENFSYKSNIVAIGKAMKVLGIKVESQYKPEVKYSQKGYYVKRIKSPYSPT